MAVVFAWWVTECLMGIFSKYSVLRAKSPQSCPILCDPMDHSPPGSSVLGILQAKILEWGSIAFSADQMHLGSHTAWLFTGYETLGKFLTLLKSVS